MNSIRKVLAVALILMAATISLAHQKKPAPKVAVESFTHDFGQVEGGTSLTFTFKIKNVGTADLLIQNVAPACGCTTSDYDKVVAPGKEGSITLAIPQTGGYAGEMSKSATVTTNDPALSTFYLTLRAYFKPADTAAGAINKVAGYGKMSGAFSVSPNDRWTTSAITGSAPATKLYLFNNERNLVRIKQVEAGGSSFKVTVTPIEDGKRYEVSISTDPALKPGQYSQKARIITDHPTKPDVILHLDVTVFAKVFATPNSVNLQQLSLNSDLANINLPLIYIRKVREAGLQVKSVNSTLPFIKIEVKTEVEGQFYTLRITFDKSKISEAGNFKGEIEVATNDAEVPVIKIPVQGSFIQN